MVRTSASPALLYVTYKLCVPHFSARLSNGGQLFSSLAKFLPGAYFNLLNALRVKICAQVAWSWT